MKRIFLSLSIVFLSLLISPRESLAKEPSKRPSNGRAVSLTIIQKILKDCTPKTSCPDGIHKLFGLERVLGYVIDDKNNDLILFGKIDGASLSLYLEDFVVALKNTWLHYATLKGNTYYYSVPGCSIDPDPGVLRELQEVAGRISSGSDPSGVQNRLNKWRNVCGKPQKVRVLGIPFNTRFGKVMVDADYYMKRLVDGSVTLDIKGFKSLTDITLDLVREDIRKSMKSGKPVSISIPQQSMSRFWFFPGGQSFLEDKGIIYFKKTNVKLLTEEEFLNESSQVTGSGRPNPLARKFAESFSSRYAEIARRRPIYNDLKGLFRFVALAKLIKYRGALSDAGTSLHYLLKEYPVKHVPVKPTLPGRSNVKEFSQRGQFQGGYGELMLWLPSCGGVSIDIRIKERDIVKDGTKRLFKFKKAVLSARPFPKAPYWDF